MCENADKEPINHLLSEDGCEGLAEEGCETRHSSQNVNCMNASKQIVGQILLSALKVKNELKTSVLQREFSPPQPVEQVSARPWRKCFNLNAGCKRKLNL